MINVNRLSAAGRSYATAHEAHYGAKQLRKALELYEGIMAAHPGTPEAGYSRSQILNIVKAVVPEAELFAARKQLALSHLEGLDAVHVAGKPSQLGSSRSSS